MQRGERVWQVAFGSGFKCNSAVWRALRPIHDTTHAAWKHIEGREDEAMRTLLTISEASKVNREWVGGGDVADVVPHASAAGTLSALRLQ